MKTSRQNYICDFSSGWLTALLPSVVLLGFLWGFDRSHQRLPKTQGRLESGLSVRNDAIEGERFRVYSLPNTNWAIGKHYEVMSMRNLEVRRERIVLSRRLWLTELWDPALVCSLQPAKTRLLYAFSMSPNCLY